MKIRESSGGRWILWIFVAVGAAVFLTGAALGITLAVQTAAYAETPAVVTEVAEGGGDGDGDALVRFEFGGQTYSDVSLGYAPRGVEEGDELVVLCKKSDPTVILRERIFAPLPFALLGFGALFCGIPLAVAVTGLKKQRKAKAALRLGVPVLCRITAVVPDISYIVNGRPVCDLLLCRPLDGKGEYRSAPFSSAKYPLEPGGTVNVYVMPDDPSVYCVDLDSVTPPDELPDPLRPSDAPPDGYSPDPLADLPKKERL